MLEGMVQSNDRLLVQVSKVHDFLKYKAPAHPVDSLLLPFKAPDDTETKLVQRINYEKYQN